MRHMITVIRVTTKPHAIGDNALTLCLASLLGRLSLSPGALPVDSTGAVTLLVALSYLASIMFLDLPNFAYSDTYEASAAPIMLF